MELGTNGKFYKPATLSCISTHMRTPPLNVEAFDYTSHSIPLLIYDAFTIPYFSVNSSFDNANRSSDSLFAC